MVFIKRVLVFFPVMNFIIFCNAINECFIVLKKKRSLKDKLLVICLSAIYSPKS